MKKRTIIEGNQAFFCVGIGMTIFREDFASAVIDSLFRPTQYGIEMRTQSGYILIDSTEISGTKAQDVFVQALRKGILKDVGYSLPDLIKGDLAHEAEAISGQYKFCFKISKYERDFTRQFELIADPSPLPDDEKLGRFVDLKITIFQEK